MSDAVPTTTITEILGRDASLDGRVCGLPRDLRHLGGVARVEVLGQPEDLDVDRLVQSLRRSVNLEGLGADQVLLDEVELLLGDAAVHPGLEQLELEGDAGGRVGCRRERPHRERLPLPIECQPRVSAVRPTALRANRLHQARGERPAEDRVRHAESDVVVVVWPRAQAADEDLGLRPIGLVDEDEVPPLVTAGEGTASAMRSPTGSPDSSFSPRTRA